MTRPLTPEAKSLLANYYASDDVRSTVGYSLSDRLVAIEAAAAANPFPPLAPDVGCW